MPRFFILKFEKKLVFTIGLKISSARERPGLKILADRAGTNSPSKEKKTAFFKRRVITTSSTGMGQCIGSVHEFGPRWSTVNQKDPSFGTRRGAEAQRERGLT
jgi:hypothetical protein